MKKLLLLTVLLCSVYSYCQNIYDSKHSQFLNLKGEVLKSKNIQNTEVIAAVYVSGVLPFKATKNIQKGSITVFYELNNLKPVSSNPKEFVLNYQKSNFTWRYDKLKNKIVGFIKAKVADNFKETVKIKVLPTQVNTVSFSTGLQCKKGVSCFSEKETIYATVNP